MPSANQDGLSDRTEATAKPTSKAKTPRKWRGRSFDYWFPLIVPLMVGSLIPLLANHDRSLEIRTNRSYSEDLVEKGAAAAGFASMGLASILTEGYSKDETLFKSVVARQRVDEFNKFIHEQIPSLGAGEILKFTDETFQVDASQVHDAVKAQIGKELSKYYEAEDAKRVQAMEREALEVLGPGFISIDIWALTLASTGAARKKPLGTLMLYATFVLIAHVCFIVLQRTFMATDGVHAYTSLGSAIVATLLTIILREWLWRAVDGALSPRDEAG